MMIRMTGKMQETAAKMAQEGRTELRSIRRPIWKQYTLIKYDGKKEISRETVWIDESKIFPSDEDFFWEVNEQESMKKAA